MGICFYCQHCGKPLNVKRDQAGMNCKCAYCNGSITVPTESVVVVRRRRAGRQMRRPDPSAEAPDSGSFLLDRPQSLEPAPPARHPIDSAPDKIWYLRHPIRGETGPLSAGQLKQMLDKVQVSADCKVWREDWADWLLAGKVFPQLGLPAAGSDSVPSNAFYDPDGKIPEAITARQLQKARQKRRVLAGVVAILAGIATIIGLAVYLIYLLSQ